MKTAAEVVIIESPDPWTAGPVGPELEILVLAQALIGMADVTFDRNDRLAVCENLDAA